MAKIQVFVNRCQILGVRWYDRLRNEELWRSTSQEPIEQQIKRRKWRWLGHTLRKPADNVTRRGSTVDTPREAQTRTAEDHLAALN